MDKWFFFFRAVDNDSIYETKIKSQIRALDSLEIDITSPIYEKVNDRGVNVYLAKGQEKSYIYKKCSFENAGIRIVVKVINLLKHEWLYTKCIKYMREKNIRVFYNRKHYLTPLDILVYKGVRNSVDKIILDIPTYPYDGEIKNRLTLYMDKAVRQVIKRYIDYVIIPSGEYEKIWGIRCINIENGVDLEKIPLAEGKRDPKVIVFTHVSGISPYHGIERFINSIIKYLNTDSENMHDIKFNIVGVGTEMDRLKYVVSKYGLEEVVVFHGFTLGERLNEIFNSTNIAIGSLALYKVGLMKAQPLKNREYAARGIPFLIGFEDIAFSMMDYVYRVPNDDTLINISEVIEWYKAGEFKGEDIRKSVEHLSWKSQMKKVVEKVSDSEGMG